MPTDKLVIHIKQIKNVHKQFLSEPAYILLEMH